MKKAINSILQCFGIKIIKLSKKTESPFFRNEHLAAALKKIKTLNIDISTIIDIGASDGCWTLTAKEFYPKKNFVLFEPLAERKEQLTKLAQDPNIYYVPFAADNKSQKIDFYVSKDLDGSGISSPLTLENSIRQIEAVRIDQEIESRNLNGPYLLKMDTHGYEIPILEGCEGILAQVEILIIECYGFKITKECLLFWEMCQYLDNLGFRIYNIFDLAERPTDFAFWQCDAVFIKKQHKVFDKSSYQ